MSERRGGPVGEERARNSAAETYKYKVHLYYVFCWQYQVHHYFVSFNMTFYLGEADLDTPKTIIRTFRYRYLLIKETLGT